jgi:hypothetical protein
MIKMLLNNWNGILASLINSTVQAAKNKARGFRSTKNLKIVVYLTIENLNFPTLNP